MGAAQARLLGSPAKGQAAGLPGCGAPRLRGSQAAGSQAVAPSCCCCCGGSHHAGERAAKRESPPSQPARTGQTALQRMQQAVSASSRSLLTASTLARLRATARRPLRAQAHLRPPQKGAVRCCAAVAEAPSMAAPDRKNPLLQDSLLPPFDTLKAEDVVPGITAILEECGAELSALEGRAEPSWEGLVDPLERITDRIGVAWGAVSHLKGVKDSEALRKAVDEVQPKRVALSLRLSQSQPLYQGFRGLREGDQWGAFSEARQRIVEGELRDFVLGGVALEGDAKARFNAIQQELSQLATDFSNNLLDATKAFKRLLTDRADVEGLPASALSLAAQQAKGEGHEGATPEEGPWLLTLDYPSYMPVMSHAKNRALREEVYRAFITRASSGKADNGPLIERTLALRQEKAQLLGYENAAEVSLASKMATLSGARQLLEELRGASYDAAKRELQEVTDFARGQGFEGDLRQWDVSYWAERQKEAQFDLTEEQLRPYFSLPAVLKGLFELAGRLFGVSVTAADGEAPVWHPDVRFFRLDRGGAPKAFFYLDPYSRPAEKRGGAWMDEVVGQSALLAPPGAPVRLPVAHMVCNQTPPIGDAPSLMTFREVETLFHEFGHALQHMLTNVTEGLAAGIRGVEWDAVELPSQFMENWCYHRATLDSFARHYQTGEPLPQDLYDKLVAARTFRSGSASLRQVHFSCLDLALHAEYRPGPGASVFNSPVVAGVTARTTVMPPLPEDRFLCGFSHIFAGGYSAGYYSYKWAEVLSADAYSAFEEGGLEDGAAVEATGRRFADTVLALGGSRAPDRVFQDFRGRPPSTEPLLRHNNLLPVAA